MISSSTTSMRRYSHEPVIAGLSLTELRQAPRAHVRLAEQLVILSGSSPSGAVPATAVEFSAIAVAMTATYI